MSALIWKKQAWGEVNAWHCTVGLATGCGVLCSAVHQLPAPSMPAAVLHTWCLRVEEGRVLRVVGERQVGAAELFHRKKGRVLLIGCLQVISLHVDSPCSFLPSPHQACVWHMHQGPTGHHTEMSQLCVPHAEHAVAATHVHLHACPSAVQAA